MFAGCNSLAIVRLNRLMSDLIPIHMSFNKKCVSHSGPFLEEVVGDDERIDLVRPADNGHTHEIEQQVGRINRIQ